MRWVSAISEDAHLPAAMDEVFGQLHDGLGGDSLDLLFVFASAHHLFDFGRLNEALDAEFGDLPRLGASAQSVLGSHYELESSPGLALLGAHLPGVGVSVRALRGDDLPPLDGSPRPWRRQVGVDAELAPSLVVLADPYTIDLDTLLPGLDFAYPGSTVVGGLASGATGPGANALFHPGGIAREGALVLALWGNVTVDAVVAQGCRPIGRPARVSACDGRVLEGLDGKTTGEFLEELFENLDESDARLARSALQLGVVVDEMRQEIGPGDFLVRNILGLHPETQALAVGAELREGQTVQFHVRDALAADTDLHRRLQAARLSAGTECAAALQWSCVGRGRRLFGRPHHEITTLQEILGPLPVAGMSCHGEIGPVGATTHLHGYTSVFGLVRPRSG